MSTKTVALDTRVYQKLSRIRRESESFSKAIDRLLTQCDSSHTGREILAGLEAFTPLRESEAEIMLGKVAESRLNEPWERHDLP